MKKRVDEVDVMLIEKNDQAMLRGVSYLSRLPDEAFHAFLEAVTIVELSSGRQLFEQGTSAAHFFVVLNGWILLYRLDRSGGRTAIHLFGPHKSFAEALLPEGSTYPVSAEAATDARIARISIPKFRAMLKTNPSLSVGLIASTFQQLRSLVDRIEQDSNWSPQRRIAAFLMNFCPSHRSSCEFQLPIEQRAIAETLSMSASTLSRTLAQLEPFGVKSRRGLISVQDIARLRQIASGTIPD